MDASVAVRARQKRAALFSGLFISCSGTVAWAQDAQPDSQPPRGSPEPQRVNVTGSNVRRTDLETPSPVQVITAQELKSSGYTHIQDVLHNITANGQGTLSQNFSGAFASGAAGISCAD